VRAVKSPYFSKLPKLWAPDFLHKYTVMLCLLLGLCYNELECLSAGGRITGRCNPTALGDVFWDYFFLLSFLLYFFFFTFFLYIKYLHKNIPIFIYFLLFYGP
jgi:hypothetical protein